MTVRAEDAGAAKLHAPHGRGVVHVEDTRARVAHHIEAMPFQGADHMLRDVVSMAFDVHAAHAAQGVGIGSALHQEHFASLCIHVEKVDVLEAT